MGKRERKRNRLWEIDRYATINSFEKRERGREIYEEKYIKGE